MTHFADDCVFYAVGGPEVFGAKIEGGRGHCRRVLGRLGQHEGCPLGPSQPFRAWRTAPFRNGPFSGTDAEGMRVEAEGADLFTLRDGKIIVKQALRKSRPPFKA